MVNDCGYTSSTIISKNLPIVTVAAALTEALVAIAAIELNPLATTDRQHVEFTKKDAADIVRAAIEKLGMGEAK